MAAVFGVWRTPDELTSAISRKLAGASPCTLTPEPREFNHEPYYTGPLIDTHVHMPTASKIVSAIAGRFGFEMPVFGGDLTIDYLTCLFESEGVTQAFGFYIIPKFAQGQTVEAVQKFEKKYPGKIIPFFMPPPMNFLNLGFSTVEGIFSKNKPLFKGIGEIKGEFENAKNLESPNLLEMYKIAERHNLVVMIHPRRNQQAATERVLAKYPEVSFLLHGGDADDWITELMAKHKNIYYTLDASLTSLYGWEKQRQSRKPSREEFLTYFRGNFDKLINKALGNWKSKIETYPDRFLWGTDRWYGWHFNKDVGGLLEEFGRTFIGKLPSAVQENFAYKNAERLLENNSAMNLLQVNEFVIR